MDIHPIRNDRDHARALRQIEKLWGAADGTPEADTLEILVILVDAYETKTHPIDPPDPIEAIKFRMEQMGLSRADLQPMIGSRARVSEVLNGQRPLTIAMINKLRAGLGIPGDVLLGVVTPARSRKRAAPVESRA
jgi:HTH-type transcriptional regulator/antitoxin HigA